MIVTIDDFLDEMCELYPDLTRASLQNICKKGMQGINRLMREGEELFINSRDVEIKFYVPMSPERQAEENSRRYFKHKRKKEKEDGEKASNK